MSARGEEKQQRQRYQHSSRRTNTEEQTMLSAVNQRGVTRTQSRRRTARQPL